MNPLTHYRLPTEDEIASCKAMLAEWINQDILLSDLIEKIKAHLPDTRIGNHSWVTHKLWERGDIKARFDLIPGWQENRELLKHLRIERS